MFERFTEEAIKVIMLSQEEASPRSQFVYRADPSVWLQKELHQSPEILGVNLIEAREEVETIIGRGSGFIGVEIPFTLAASAFLSYAWKKRAFWGTTTLAPNTCLSLIRDGQGGCKSIRNLGVDPRKSAQVIQMSPRRQQLPVVK